MTKLFIFDIDGTLVEPGSLNPLSGSQKAVSYYHSKGFICVGINDHNYFKNETIVQTIEYYKSVISLFPELNIIFASLAENKMVGVRQDSPTGIHEYIDPDTHRQVREELAETHLRSITWEPYHYRKPSVGMIAATIAEFGDLLNPYTPKQRRNKSAEGLTDCWLVGNRPEDFELAQNAHIDFIWSGIMLDKFNPGLHERAIANLEKEVLLRFLAI